jgi:hypothetical protein
MLPPTAVTGIAAALGGYANHSRDVLPNPQFEIIYEYAPKTGPLELDFNLIHESVWRGWDARFARPTPSDEPLPEQVELLEFLDLVTATAPRWLPEQQRDARLTIFGFTLMYDEPPTIPTNHDAGDSLPGPAVTRVLLAVDLDGRRYEIPPGAGHPSGSVQVSEPGTPLPDDADSPGQRHRRAALSALAHLAEVAAALPAPQPADRDGTEDADPDVLVAGELVIVTGDRFDDDQRKQLWVVVDAFFDYTIAVLGGDGYQWARIPRSELTPVTPQWIRRVIRGDRTFGYIGADSAEPTL